jgi:FlaA1/EpsC-like NDP-sugar epimerase
MNKGKVRSVDKLLALPRRAKKTLAVLTDASLCALTVWLAICFRFESWVTLSGYQWLAVVLSILLAIPLLTAFGFYHTVIRFIGRQTIVAALRAVGIYAVIYSSVFTVVGFPLVPRTIGILQPLLLLIGLALVRLIASQLLAEQTKEVEPGEESAGVLIYGAGSSGQQLATSLKMNGQTRIVGFLDDNKTLHNAHILGFPIHSPDEINDLIERHSVSGILLAIPSLTKTRRNEILRKLSGSRLSVRTLPSLSDLAQGKVSENQLREVEIDDLLGRDPVKPIASLLNANISNKRVLVSGAGGSIGSELCRQILKLSPLELILLDSNEFSLYSINEELLPIAQMLSLKLTLVLANVQLQEQIEQVIEAHKPDTIYHAAAYKHVPLVESNPIVGLRNNVLGTNYIARAAAKFNAKDFVLISTDKAVRPTNVMGASKRISEMLLQSIAQNQHPDKQGTKFSIVRFGNVLGSSGSVIPKFKEQIKNGGPITLTHPEITRYFMTIPEAALLVIQASGIPAETNTTASVYLLDMGESVKILDLARTLIQLSGKNELSEEFPNDSIEIKYVGLRPGEKLYEELLIENTSKQTVHPKILVSNDAGTPDRVWIEQTVRTIEQLHITQDKKIIASLLAHPGIGYSPEQAKSPKKFV